MLIISIQYQLLRHVNSTRVRCLAPSKTVFSVVVSRVLFFFSPYILNKCRFKSKKTSTSSALFLCGVLLLTISLYNELEHAPPPFLSILHFIISLILYRWNTSGYEMFFCLLQKIHSMNSVVQYHRSVKLLLLWASLWCTHTHTHAERDLKYIICKQCKRRRVNYVKYCAASGTLTIRAI